MTNRRYWVVIVVLLLSFAGLRALSHGEHVPPMQPLAQTSAQIGKWVGHDVPVEQRIIDAVAVDDYLNRVYIAEDDDPVYAYVGYYKSQRTGQTIHSPRNCLPGSGWQPVRSERMELQLHDGRVVPVNLYIIEKGVNRLLVLYWYQSHGRIVASEYWGKYYLVEDALRLNRTDAALVRIATTTAPNEAAARIRAAEFARNLIDQIGAISAQ